MAEFADELREVWTDVYDGPGSDEAAWLAVAKHVAKLLRDAIKAHR
jgi:hypothetical protein